MSSESSPPPALPIAILLDAHGTVGAIRIRGISYPVHTGANLFGSARHLAHADLPNGGGLTVRNDEELDALRQLVLKLDEWDKHPWVELARDLRKVEATRDSDEATLNQATDALYAAAATEVQR